MRTRPWWPAVPVVLVLAVPVARAGDLVTTYGAMAIRGDVSGAKELFAHPDSSWTDPDRELAGHFAARFVDGEEEPLARDTAPFIGKVLRAYHAYWRAALLGANREAVEDELAETLRVLPPPKGAARRVADTDPLDWLAIELEREGLHALTGRTRPLLDLMIWAREDTTSWSVELTDGTIPVEVVFVREFLAKGWTDWATFGRSSTGGWATPERLFCLEESYDVDSETFRVSYLKHEGRHFADYGRFPALGQPDLEYRAKLTEVAFADSTLRDLLTGFAAAAAFDAGSPHAWASACLVRDLGRVLSVSGDTGAEEGAPWPSVPAAEIRKAARQLIEEHSAHAVAAGADTCHVVVGPHAG